MKLKIENLELLQVTKVKPWAIYFKYNGEHYMLHERSDGYDVSTTLYKRNIDKGHYQLEPLDSHWNPLAITLYVGECGNKQGMPYSHIRKDIFVKKLLKDGFSEGLYEDEYNALLLKEKGLRLAIKAITEEINELFEEFWK